MVKDDLLVLEQIMYRR